MLLSDRDIRAEIEAGRVALDPWDPEMIQPSSIDVRLDRYFRVFDNHKYASIDPSIDQPELTRLVDITEGPFVLHPGEFVLGSTYESVTLPDDVAARLEGKSSLGRLGLLTHSTAGFIDPGFEGNVTLEPVQHRDAAHQPVARHEDRPTVLLPPVLPRRAPLRLGEVRLALPRPAWPHGIAQASRTSTASTSSREFPGWSARRYAGRTRQGSASRKGIRALRVRNRRRPSNLIRVIPA
ncbi:hypothetical protein GCM10025876_22500 [Demequina litorisediminis]|uniref:Uncharacterized protein n=1 Tax=Demequina litorisediminis TaxID=1849022 RepID=A0ABQ6IFU2_9MICO|nr:hypothetical protein GCM10025876_22500 [Demequina litorisediminis]